MRLNTPLKFWSAVAATVVFIVLLWLLVNGFDLLGVQQENLERR